MIIKGKETLIKFGTYKMTDKDSVEKDELELMEMVDSLIIPTQSGVDEILKQINNPENSDEMN